MKKYILQGTDTVKDAPFQYAIICSSVPSDVLWHFVCARGGQSNTYNTLQSITIQCNATKSSFS